jgi:hypothetical protein
MDDLISRKAVRLALSEVDMPKSVIETEFYDVMSNVADRLIAVPSVDAAPVKHGRWEPSEKYFGYNKCSVCADCYIDPEWAMNGKWHYCPNCGAKMDLEG